MVKYGKQYREYQIEEWKPHYINYKALKQKIKQIKAKLPKEEEPSNTLFGVSNLNPMPLIPDNIDSTEDQNLAPLFESKYGKYLKDFIDLLNKEFHKFYIFFSSTEKQLYQEINTHLYAKDNYNKYSKKQIKNEMNSLGVSIYLAKCLNCFINDNLTAVKKILKKFDKNFVNYYGLIAPRYILSQISSTTNDLDYIIQFKIIDEASCVCEENANILKELYFKIGDNINIDNDIENNNVPEIQVDFMQQYKELLMCVREIDEIIDFKIQYKEWFSFIKKGNKLIKNNPTLLENDIFNPLLSSTNYKDSLIEKFLSTKKAFYEIEDVQISVSEQNKRNMNLILIHKFFYNTLLTSFLPLIFFFTKADEKKMPTLSSPCAIIILSLSHIGSYISLYFFNFPDTKVMMLISYLLFFISSLLHIISCNIDFSRNNNLPRIIYLIISRMLIGIGSMELIGRKYIELFSPKFYLIRISKYYSIINFFGYAAGPLITCFLLLFPKNYEGYINYNEFNCIGWYGNVISLFLFFIQLFLFTKPNADDFQMIRDEHNLKFTINTSFHSEEESRKEKPKKKLKKNKKHDDIDIIVTKTDLTEGLVPDDEDKNEDKNEENNEENNKVDKDKKEGEGTEDEILNINQIQEDSKSDSNKKKKKKRLTEEELNEKYSQSANSLIRVNIGRPSDLSICSNNLDTGLNSSQILSTKQKKMINNIESKLDEYNEKSNFTNINMIPRAIDLLIEKEKNQFGYLKTNILVTLLIIFFSNVIKEHITVSFSYFYYEEKFDKKLICLVLCFSYLTQIISLFFVLPLKKINILMKKYLTIFMTATIIFLSPLLYPEIFRSKSLVLLIVIPVILLCTILVILNCCYLAYLLPPGWTFSSIHAGKLPLILIICGKFVGILISPLYIIDKKYNVYAVFAIAILSFVAIIIYLLGTNNFRIKVIARIMRKRVFENIGI